MSLDDTAEVLGRDRLSNETIEMELKEKLMSLICEENGLTREDLDLIPLGKDLKRK